MTEPMFWQPGQRYPSLNSVRGDFDVHDDGPIDLHFDPEPPAAGASHWIQTVAGTSWSTVSRVYGPLESWNDQSWRPGHIELVAE